MSKRDFDPIHPGEILLEEFLRPMDISQYRLAKDISVPQRRISEISESVRERFPFQLQTHFILDKANPCTINASDISSNDVYNRAL